MRLLVLLISLILIGGQAPAQAATSTTGNYGQVLSINKKIARNGEAVTVTGRLFDETVGIYLAFCVVPAKGSAPTPCGGGVNKAGIGESSYWISSNPPPYALGLTDEYLPGGRFTHKVKVSRMVAKFDCRKVSCAITVRADHLRTGDRTHDLFIPITIKK